ncbi:MAG: glycoside hydrolase family 28 protein [Spirosomataceae bacterium]
MAKSISLVLWSILLLYSTVGYTQSVKKVKAEIYGAVSDGRTLNTRSIQKAIDELSQKGGGTLVFSSGNYLTGSIQLKSNVTLHLEKGAVLLGSTHPEDYQKLDIADGPISPKTDDNSKLALILANRSTNMAITGSGTINGQGRELALTIDSLHHSGLRKDPAYDIVNNRPSETSRPKLIHFSECSHIEISGITLLNSACWVQTYELCEHVILDRLNVESRAYWNNDGMDITDCRHVKITHCQVNTADDGICLKSYYPGHFNDQIYIAHCSIRSSASAIKFGTASVGGFKNVQIDQILVRDTYRSAIAIESVDGGFIENIQVSNILAENTGNALFIRLGHRSGEKPGYVRNIRIQKMKVQVPFGRPDELYDMRGPALPFFHNPIPSPITGIPNFPIENVSLENIEIRYPGRASKGMAYIPISQLHRVPEKIKDYPEFSMFGELPSWGFYIRHVTGISVKNITLTLDNPDFRPAFVLEDVTNAILEKINLPEPKKDQIILKDSRVSLSDTQYVDLLKK